MRTIHPQAFQHCQHLPNHHRLLKASLEFLLKHSEIDGVFLKGGLATGILGPFSSLDFGIFCQNSKHRDHILSSHSAWKISPGIKYLKAVPKKAYTVTFVSEPNLHLEFQFHVANDLPEAEEGPFVIAWDSSGHLGTLIKSAAAGLDWSEVCHEDEQFWAWTHFSASTAARGEFHEVLQHLEDLREIVQVWQSRLDVMARQNSMKTGNRFRPEFIERLTKTYCPPHGDSIKNAFKNLIKIQLQQRALIARTVGPQWKVSPGTISRIQEFSISWK